jgi:SPX domain protein involved in polyphosphate accumulation
MYPYLPLTEEHTFIKKLLKITQDGAEREFKKTLRQEIINFDKYCTTTYHRLQTAIFNIIVRFTEADLDFESIEIEVNQIHNTIIYFNGFIGSRFKYFVRLRHDADRKLGRASTASKFADSMLLKYKFGNIGMGDFICMMSDIYYTLSEMKKAQEEAEGGGGTWVPPSAFVRSTRKYWVRLEDLTKLKLAICKHLPLLRFGKKQGLNLSSGNAPTSQIDYSRYDNSYHNNGEGDAAKITSVYFDNEKLRLYHDKIVRKEGATLIRIRWYGEEGKTCFMERKTWHDSWVLNDSIKERFDIKWQQVIPFISGTLKASEYVESLQGNAKYDTTALREILGLAEGIQERILKLQLHPNVRTTYWRTAFQRADNNNIRISIDTSLELSKEPRDPGHDRWCRDITDGIPDDEFFLFPMAVLEIKLHSINETPQWLQDIVNSDYVVSAYKFSKFMHGTAKLFGTKTKVLPAWFNRTCTHIPGHPLKNWYRQSVQFIPNKLDFDGVLEWQSLQPKAVPQETLNSVNFFDGKDSDWSIDSESSSDSDVELGEKTVKLLTFADAGDKSTLRRRRPTPTRMPGASGPKSPQQKVMLMNGMIDNQDEEYGNTSNKVVVTGSIEKGGPRLNTVFDMNKKPKKAGITSVLQATGYEPKTNVALERTFLFWQRCFFLLVISSLLFTVIQYPDRIIFGTILSSAIIISIYGLIVFLIRRKLIRTRSVDGHFDDKWGATVLGVLCFIAIFILLVWQTRALGFGVYNNSTIPSFTRVYAASLPVSLFNESTDTGLLWIDQSIKEQLPDFLLLGQLTNLVGEQSLTYWDTISCALLYNGYVLKSVTDTDLRYTSMALEFLTADKQLLKQMDLKFPLAEYYRVEYFSSPDNLNYGFSKVLPLVPYVDVFSLLNVAQYFEPFYLWDFTDKLNWNLPLQQVSGTDLQYTVYGDLKINLGSTERDASVRVNIWNQNNRPIFAELTLSYPVAGLNLTFIEMQNAKKVYNAMKIIGANRPYKTFTDYLIETSWCQ